MGECHAQGSSPLARGTPVTLTHLGFRARLIPARAGNTNVSTPVTAQIRAHPRSRGEHITGSLLYLIVLGSSPLARGTPKDSGEGEFRAGLIPARAGNTLHPGIFLNSYRAHPRSRGEHTRKRRGGKHYGGSSPLARGTSDKFRDSTGTFGLIPARAGNTRHRHERGSSPVAHPRSRGEHSLN